MNAILTLENHKTNNLKEKTHKPSSVARFAVSAAFSALFLSGCFAIPVGQDASGNPVYVYSSTPVIPAQVTAGVPMAVPGGPMPQALNVKLYPINDVANQTGVLTGEV